MNYASTAHAPEHSTSRIIAQTLAWVISVATLVVGFLLYLKGQSLAVTAQIGASDGTITEAKDYYGNYTKGTSMVTLGSALIAVAILALVVLFALAARSRFVVAPVAVFPSAESPAENTDLFEGFASEDGSVSTSSDGAAGAEILVSDVTGDATGHVAVSEPEDVTIEVTEEDPDAESEDNGTTRV